MVILSDVEIRNYIESGKLVIKPIFEDTIRENGLDLRIGPEIARFKRKGIFEIGKSRIEDFYEIERGDSFIIQPHEHILIHTVEYLRIPNDLIGFVNLRSTFARLGISIPSTIIDAGFEGQLTIEIIGGEFSVKIPSNERFLHIILAKLSSPVKRAYQGKYKGQTGVKLPEF